MYEKYMLVKGKHFEINRITNFHSTSSELYFEKSSNMTKTIWQKWVITFFYEIHSAHLIYPRVKWTCAGKYVERVKSHSWALGAGLNCRAGKLEGRVNTPRIRYSSTYKHFILLWICDFLLAKKVCVFSMNENDTGVCPKVNIIKHAQTRKLLQNIQ